MASTAASAGENSEPGEANVQVSGPCVLEISVSRSETMNPRVTRTHVLIIVENQAVPFDRRVWREACSLRENGYEVTVLCPRRKSSPKGYEVIEGVHIYRHPSPGEGRTATGYLWEYGWSLFWQFL